MQNVTTEKNTVSSDMLSEYMSKHDKREVDTDMNVAVEVMTDSGISYSTPERVAEPDTGSKERGGVDIDPIIKENVWESDQADFVPTRQTMSFDAKTGALFADIPGNGAIPVDSYDSRVRQKKRTAPLNKRRYLFLLRECKDKFIVTSFLTNIRIDSIKDFREMHHKIIEDFTPYIHDYNENVPAEKYLEQYLSESSKTFRTSAYEDVVLVVHIKEKVGEDPVFKTIPLQFEVTEKDEDNDE